MTLLKMLQSWGVIEDLESAEDIFLPEYLGEKYPAKCFFADIFPVSVETKNAHKYDQLEEKVCNLVYDRMQRVLWKLWALDNLWFESYLLYNKHETRESFWNLAKKRRLAKQLKTRCIEREEHLDKLLQLSQKNVIDLAFSLENMRVILVPSWACFFLFVEDEKVLPVLEEILTVEGLHLRRHAEN